MSALLTRFLFSGCLVLMSAASAAAGASVHAAAFGDCVVEMPDKPGKSAAIPLGARTVLVLIVDFADVTVEQTYEVGDPVDYVAGVMYDYPSNTAEMIGEASFGRTSIRSDADGDGRHDIFRVAIESSIAGAPCHYHAWSDRADAAAEALGVDLSLYDNRMYVLPLVEGCGGWAGRAEFLGVRSWMRTIFQTAYPHELGHNFGLHHASTDPDNDGEIDEPYGDTSDVMGSAPEWRQFNAPHKVQMGWLPPSAIHDVTGGGSRVFTLSAVEIDPALALFPQVVRVSRPDVPERPYYLSYRGALGYDVTLDPAYRDRLQIHTADISESVETHYVAGLDDGASYADPAAHGLLVTQLAHDATTATFELRRTEPDLDGDGHGETGDCDDLAAAIHPGAAELCDGLDNDCNGEVDDAAQPDPDLDAVCSAFDNCAEVANADQRDRDGDGLGDACDCDPGDPANAAVLAPVTDLVFHDATALEWRVPGAGAEVVFDVLRSETANDFALPECLISDAAGPGVADPENPQAVFFYLVRAEAACGARLGATGTGERPPAGECRSLLSAGEVDRDGEPGPASGR